MPPTKKKPALTLAEIEARVVAAGKQAAADAQVKREPKFRPEDQIPAEDLGDDWMNKPVQPWYADAEYTIKKKQ